jgi:hypothetical protein
MHCKKCDEYSESDFNHGESILRGIAKAAPHCRAAQEADSSGYLEISVLGGGSELISFCNDHEGHELELADEYGRFEPLEKPRKKQRP